MIGLIILIVGVIYCAVLVVATRAAYRWAKSKGFSKAKCWLAAMGGFLALYLPVFWDHIPTLIAHQYYCATEAGFWVYKTPEQWRKENPGVAETLTYSTLSSTSSDPEDGAIVTSLNERFDDKRSYNHLKFIPVTIFNDVIFDRKKNEFLVKHVTAGAGYGNPLTGSDLRSMKFWLNLGSCEGEDLLLYGQYESMRQAYKKIGEKK